MARRDPYDRPRAETRSVGIEAAVYRDRARRLGLSFVSSVEIGTGAVSDSAAIRSASFAMSSVGDRLAYIAPREDALPAIRHWLAAYPSARSRLRVSTPSAISAALIVAGQEWLAEEAVERLASVHPHLSARQVVAPRQVAAGLALIAIAAFAAYHAPLVTLTAVNLVAAAFFFSVSALRLVAAGHAGERPPPIRHVDSAVPEAGLPVYTILVPLRDEADLVPDLIAALDRIDWPRDRLDIKLLLEAGDTATAAAARFAAPGAPYEIVLVPPIGPRTKPKALAFALPFVRGAYVTVYDAEDRPHPRQLREAFAVFAGSDPDVACLQSALVIDNATPNWLSRSFAIEYAALFDALLPTLSALRMPLPLGGTSNHFRRSALEAVGGWDPFNVTEAADLGVRLARFGFRSATLDLPTLEEAPTTLAHWFRQRTRWSKGWMQTWLVHTRYPARLARELGARGFLGFNLISTGLVVSTLIYPIYLAALVGVAADPLRLWRDGGVFAAMIVGVNLFNLVAGYAAMAILGWRALRLRGRRREARGLILLPVYWLLASLAAYRAVFQLISRPHHWEKTPHRRRRPRAETPRRRG